jgi:hypothetical protein
LKGFATIATWSTRFIEIEEFTLRKVLNSLIMTAHSGTRSAFSSSTDCNYSSLNSTIISYLVDDSPVDAIVHHLSSS